MKPVILLPIAVLVSIGLLQSGCRSGPELLQPDSPLASELKLLERQVAALKEAIHDSKRGELFSSHAIAIGVSEDVVQGVASQALPIERALSEDFTARIERVTVSFRSMQGAVKLEGRVWAVADPRTWADLVLLGGINDVEIDEATGVLKAQIVLDGWDVQRAVAVGMEFEWTKDLVRLLGDRGLGALRDLVPDLRIPVGIERGIDLPGTSGGAVLIPAGHLPLDAAVSRVLPMSGRLWAMIDVKTTGWERAGSRPRPTPEVSGTAPR